MGNWSKRRTIYGGKKNSGSKTTMTSSPFKTTYTTSKRMGNTRIAHSTTSDGKSRTITTEYNPYLGTKRTVKTTTNKTKKIKNKPLKTRKISRSRSKYSGPVTYSPGEKKFFKVAGFILLTIFFQWWFLGPVLLWYGTKLFLRFNRWWCKTIDDIAEEYKRNQVDINSKT